MITLSNVRSLNNKMDVILRMKHEEDFRHSNMICFTETWLNCNHTLELCGFGVSRADRDQVKSGKSVGGGLCMFTDKNSLP